VTGAETTVKCSCGESHAHDQRWLTVVELVEVYGETIVVATPKGRWNVPRAYIAMHGLKEQDLPMLADKYGWTTSTASRGVRL
jgi:hypothetical protein